MKRIFVKVLCFLLIVQHGYTQLSSDKSGAITYNNNAIADVIKYGGNASVRPKFWVISTANDTVLHINFKKEFDSDWMQFEFRKAAKVVEINTGEIIKGLNYRKNIASFLLANNLITPEGKICDTAFERFVGNHTENLTEKYHKQNEFNYKMAAARFDYFTEDGRLVVNSNVVGYATAPAKQGVLIRGIVLYDLNKNVIARGERFSFGDVTLKLIDGKEINVKASDGNTMDNYNQIRFFQILLRELCRIGFYPF
ncbi:hypothetical protein A4H97_04520 [Niastella yeongjuensis]|uniref:Uncharacterized protein n=1 Tax=Niastella yeongjuensis TaxID=354355 RepID=A0A1V9EY55_9BACT|nr:hypothetical protein [Niastella yeongjuensis]OQP51083.1 hypothetical protein A4H97_04520 [Niastella yeongjuensis]SEN03517.1 hypothetical protein SAMN05660816_00029 [Niastella yeongjuensis]